MHENNKRYTRILKPLNNEKFKDQKDSKAKKKPFFSAGNSNTRNES